MRAAPDREPDGNVIRGLIGVYNAEGSLRGKVAYVGAKVRGFAPCALCDITHRGFRTRRDFTEIAGRLPAPIELIHLDDRSEEIGAASGWLAPCVLARTDAGLHVLVGPGGLGDCHGSPAALVDAIREAAQRQALRWPAS